MKKLSDILETYPPRSKDEKQFVAMHKVSVQTNAPYTKDDKLFKASNIKQALRKPDRHGYEPGEDLDKYDAGRATAPGTMKSVMGKQIAPTTTYESEESLDEMHHIYTIQNKDGSFDEVGMNNRSIDKGISRNTAVNRAKKLSDTNGGKKVRVQTWASHEFYKNDSKPLTTYVGKDVNEDKSALDTYYSDPESKKKKAHSLIKKLLKKEDADLGEAHTRDELDKAIKTHAKLSRLHYDISGEHPSSSKAYKRNSRRGEQHYKAAVTANYLYAKQHGKRTYTEDVVDESHTIKQLKQAADAHRFGKLSAEKSAERAYKGDKFADASRANKLARKHDKARKVADDLRWKLQDSGKVNISQLRKEDVLDEDSVAFRARSSVPRELSDRAEIRKDGAITFFKKSKDGSSEDYAKKISDHLKKAGIPHKIEIHKAVIKKNDDPYASTKRASHVFATVAPLREDEMDEEHLGFKKLENKLAHKKGIYDPAGLAAAIGRKKYGDKKFDAKAKANEDVNLQEEWDSDYHYHHDQFHDHNRDAVKANEQFKHYSLNSDLAKGKDDTRSALQGELANMYKKLATHHLKLAAYHGRQAGLKSR